MPHPHAFSPPDVRATALHILRIWKPEGVFAEDLVERETVRARQSGRDRAMVQALVFAVLRHRALLDWWIDHLRSGSLENSVRDLLRLGLAGAILLDHAPHAAVNECVNLAGRARGLVNALLRRALRERAELQALRESAPLHVRHSLPEFLAARWEKRFGAADADRLGTLSCEPSAIFVRANALREGAAEKIAALPGAQPVPGHPDFFTVPDLPREALTAGLCYAQDPSTALAPRLLSPQPGTRVLDACAAPGGKCALLAALMQGRGEIIATDSAAPRLQTLTENMTRMNVTCAQPLVHDWARSTADIPPFDAILADVPCSNTGVLRRRVDVRWRLKPEWMREVAALQKKILHHLLPTLKPGGTLVYSTCSIEPEENAEIVSTVLATHPGFRLEKDQTLLPHRDAVDGAYAARIVREA